MYDTSFICTYNLIDNDDESNELYKIQFLQAFKINDWDDKIIGREIDNIYAKIKDTQIIKTALNKLRDNKQLAYLLFFTGNSDDSAFRLLFSYDLFYLTHKCICEFINNNNISDITSNALFDKL